MKKIITISREYGSGGRLIGKLVAEKLGYKFYDKEIIEMAAQESGLSADFITKTEQNLSSGFLYNLLLGSSYAGTATGTQAIGGSATLPLADQVFNAERNTILKIAKDEPCVIVGRCADYILSTADDIDNKELLNVFIYAEEEDKIKRITEDYKDNESSAKKEVVRINKRRANHYNMFTDSNWGDRKNYDILLNSSTFGIQQTAEIIANFVKNN